MSPPLQGWHHTHRTLCNFVITTSPLISHPFWYDITPTLCVTSYALYITSHPLLKLYLWQHTLYIWNHILYIGQHIHYTCEIRATNLCPQTHFIDNIKPTLCMTSHLAYVRHLSHYTRHHILTLWHQTTVFMTSHPLYLTSYPLYLCHHTQIISHITHIVCMISQPKYVWHHMNYIWHHIHSLWYHTTLWHHTHSIHVITPRMSDIASNVAAPLLTLYGLNHTFSMCDTKPTTWMTSYEFYTTSHLLFITSKICIHDITPTLFMTSHPFYLTSQSLNLCCHTRFIDDITACMDVITLGLSVTSYILYMIPHALFMISHHSMTSQQLYSCHHTQYIWHHINWSCFVSVLIVPQLPLLWHQPHYMYDSCEFYMTSYPHFMTS